MALHSPVRRGAKRFADAHLGHATRRPGRRQVDEVHTGDEQYKDGHDREDQDVRGISVGRVFLHDLFLGHLVVRLDGHCIIFSSILYQCHTPTWRKRFTNSLQHVHRM